MPRTGRAAQPVLRRRTRYHSPAMSSRPVLLSCEAVSKQFGARPLFHDLSFALFEGDRVGLVGPPGTGVRDFFLAAVMVAIVPRAPLEKRSAATTQSSTSISC